MFKTTTVHQDLFVVYMIHGIGAQNMRLPAGSSFTAIKKDNKKLPPKIQGGPTPTLPSREGVARDLMKLSLLKREYGLRREGVQHTC